MRVKPRSLMSAIAAAVLLCLVAAPVGAQAAPTPPATQPPLPELVAPPLPAGAASPVPTDRPITLKDAIALALREQPALALSGAALAAAAGRTRQAASGYFPTLSVSAQRTQVGPSAGGGAGGTSTGGAYTTNLSGRQLLYDFGKTPSQVAQARNAQQSASQALAQARQDIVNQVKQAYYTLLQDRRLVKVQERNVSDQQAHLELARARFEAGLAPHSDVVRAETAVSNAILNLATAQNAAAVARVTLNIVMGVDARARTTAEETEEPLPALPAAEALVEQALGNRPEIRQLRADVAAAQAAVSVARTTNRPSLFANGNYGLSGTDFPPSDKSWAYGVSLQWPIFDVGLTKGRVEETQANVRSALANLRQGEQTVGSEVVQAYLDVRTADQKVKAAAGEVANAEESLGLATGRYQAGVAAYIEVIDAETALITAQTNQVNAVYGLSIARAALARALGMEGY